MRKCLLYFPAANEGWLACHSPWGGVYPVRGALPAGTAAGFKFPTPGVVLLLGLRLSSAALRAGTSAAQ